MWANCLFSLHRLFPLFASNLPFLSLFIVVVSAIIFFSSFFLLLLFPLIPLLAATLFEVHIDERERERERSVFGLFHIKMKFMYSMDMQWMGCKIRRQRMKNTEKKASRLGNKQQHRFYCCHRRRRHRHPKHSHSNPNVLFSFLFWLVLLLLLLLLQTSLRPNARKNKRIKKDATEPKSSLLQLKSAIKIQI